MSHLMKHAILLLLTLLAAGCLGERDVNYAEFRLHDRASGVELLGFVRMESAEDCETRRQRVLENFARECKDCRREFTSTCMPAMPERYAKLFDNAPIHATYLAFERGRDRDERDMRAVIFGVPSSQAMQLCPRVRDRFKGTYSGRIDCVQGSVG